MDKNEKNVFAYNSQPACITLHRVPVMSSVSIDEKIYRKSTIEERKDFDEFINNKLTREMKMYLYENKHPEKVIIKYPADWVESIKERFAPSWFLDRYPVKFIEHTATLKEIYPFFDKAIPNEEAIIKFYVQKKVVDYPTW